MFFNSPGYIQQEPFNIEAAIIAITFVFLILAAFIIMIMVVYRKRRNNHIIDNLNLQAHFKQELLKTQIEIQEQTFMDVSRELHDNVSQVLSFVKLNLAFSGNLNDAEKNQRVTDSRELLGQAISDLRHLSKSLSFEHISSFGLVKIMENEVERINKSRVIRASLIIEGVPSGLGEQRELVLFRIFQETLNNTLKHSGAKHLQINLQYSNELFNLSIVDDGAGFSIEQTQKDGSGLKNIENRAGLVGAAAVISSSPGNGCCITVTLNPFKQQSIS